MSDLYYDKVSLLLPMSGANNGTEFTDYSPVPKVGTRYNAVTSTAQSKFYGSSGLFDGNGDYLSFPHHADYPVGTDDFTIEFWIRAHAAGAAGASVILIKASSITYAPYYVQIATGTYNVKLYCSDAASWDVNGVAVASLTQDVWSHCEICRVGSYIYCFQDGVNASTTNMGNLSLLNAATPILIGGVSGANYLNGNINDLRITKGLGRHTTDFTPPSKMTGMGLSGTVLDDAGDPAARRIVAHSRLDPRRAVATTSSAGDGSYAFSDLVDTAQYLVCLDDEAGTQYNSLILDRMAPA